MSFINSSRNAAMSYHHHALTLASPIGVKGLPFSKYSFRNNSNPKSDPLLWDHPHIWHISNLWNSTYVTMTFLSDDAISVDAPLEHLD